MLSTIPPVAPASKSLDRPGCLIDLSWYLVVPRSVAGSSGAPDDVWESLFRRLVDEFADITENRLFSSATTSAVIARRSVARRWPRGCPACRPRNVRRHPTSPDRSCSAGRFSRRAGRETRAVRGRRGGAPVARDHRVTSRERARRRHRGSGRALPRRSAAAWARRRRRAPRSRP